MARDHARIYLALWEDPDWLRLTAFEQWAYWALLASPDLTWAGVAPLLPQRIAAMGRDVTPTKVSRAFDSLAVRRYLIIDADTAEVAIRTFIRHDGILGQPFVLCGSIKAWGKIHSHTIRGELLDEYAAAYTDLRGGFGPAHDKAFAKSFPAGFPAGFGDPFGRPSPEPSGRPSPEPSGRPSPEPSATSLLPSPLSLLPPVPSETQGSIGTYSTRDSSRRLNPGRGSA